MLMRSACRYFLAQKVKKELLSEHDYLQAAAGSTMNRI